MANANFSGIAPTVELVDSKTGAVVERLGPGAARGPIPLGSGYNPDEAGKLAAKYWAANKGTELHWFQGACAHARIDFETALTELEYDAAVEGAKGISIGIQSHHPNAGLSSVVIDRAGTALKAAPPPPVSPIPPAPEPK